jgi:predicted CopG family antitoxin
MKTLTIRLPEKELELLKTYCDQENRSQTDVIREFIRSLKRKTKSGD